MEVSSHALAQQRLGTAQVATAIFTNLSQDHGDFHPTMEDYYLAKRRLFTTHLAPGGTAIVNLDSDYGARLHRELATLRPDVTRLSFAVRQPADLAVHSCLGSINGARLVLTVHGERVACQSPLTGDFNVSNVLGALGAALALGVPLPTAIGAVERFTGVPGRLERLPARHGINIFVDYAHCPDALTNVLSTLAAYRTGRLIVVFGCGGDRDPDKRPNMAREAARFADLTIVTSDNPRTEDPEKILDKIEEGFTSGQPWRRICDRREAIFAAVAEARPGDTIVLAGKGHEDYQEIHGQHYRFLDREVAADALRQFDLLAESPES
jgi:UDP-N-acetylmuramoyl-L-alanyl-D-glutamate--2,6-diaminopimelate ligase